MAVYKVVVADNAHYMDAGEQDEQGGFATYEAAVAACRAIVDRSLAWHYRPGMSADDLHDTYTSFGDDPFIVGPDTRDRADRFSAWTYAKERCAAIAG